MMKTLLGQAILHDNRLFPLFVPVGAIVDLIDYRQSSGGIHYLVAYKGVKLDWVPQNWLERLY